MEELENLSLEELEDAELSDLDLRELEEEFLQADGDEADQPEPREGPEDEAEAADQPEAGPSPEEEYQAEQTRFRLKHLGETREVDRAEVIALAQKGMDYDRIRGRNADMEAFIQELARGENLEAGAFMDETRARKLAAQERIELPEARQRVQADKQARARQAAEAETKRAAARRREDILDFVRRNKGVDVNSIPKEVWLEVGGGRSLVDAYAQHENRLLKGKVRNLEEKLKAGAQNQRGRSQSTGSQKSAGKGRIDPIDAWWYEEDD